MHCHIFNRFNGGFSTMRLIRVVISIFIFTCLANFVLGQDEAVSIPNLNLHVFLNSVICDSAQEVGIDQTQNSVALSYRGTPLLEGQVKAESFEFSKLEWVDFIRTISDPANCRVDQIYEIQMGDVVVFSLSNLEGSFAVKGRLSGQETSVTFVEPNEVHMGNTSFAQLDGFEGRDGKFYFRLTFGESIPEWVTENSTSANVIVIPDDTVITEISLK
jgi:hypothetical protein